MFVVNPNIFEESTLTTVTQISKCPVSLPKPNVALDMGEKIEEFNTTWSADYDCEVRWVGKVQPCALVAGEAKWLKKLEYLPIKKGQEVRAAGNPRIGIKE